MLLEYDVMSKMGSIYKYLDRMAPIPLQWDPSKELVVHRRRHVYGVFWLIVYLLLTLSCIQQAKLYNAVGDIGSMCLAMATATGTAVATSWEYSMMTSSKDTANFLNGVISLEKQHGEKIKKLKGKDINPKAKMLMAMSKGFVGTLILAPILIALGSGILPCVPLNYAWSFIDCDADKKYSGMNTLKFFGIAIFNWITWQKMLKCGMIVVIHLLLGALCQELNIKKFEKDFLHVWPLRAKQEKKFNNTILFYRELQLLNLMFNTAQVGFLVTTLIGSLFVQAINMFVMMKGFGGDLQVGLPALISCTFFALDAVFVIMVIFGVAARVHEASTNILDNIPRNLGLQKRSNFITKFFMSCPVMKIQFGVTNYIEVQTPLVFEDFTIARFIDLVLLDKETNG